MSNPYLSIVLVGRNDNYGGDFRERLQMCISGLFEQLNRFRIHSEIIFVNYNPLPEPDIKDFIAWHKSTDYVSIRIITVPSEVHEKFVLKHGIKNVPVNEYLGKNAGIRRSKGEYILCMNPDILFPDELVKYVLKGLQQCYFYRANRIDFDFVDGKKQLLRINLKGHSPKIQIYSEWATWFLNLKYAFINWYMINSVRIEKFLNRIKKPVFYDNAELRFHCKTSGDFMLMHHSHWMATEGYFETSAIALHIDSLFVIQTAMYGLKEKVIKFPIYHREHERRFTANNDNPEELDAYKRFQHEAQMMLKQKKNKIFNQNNWGLIDLTLPEINS